jgi:hypothetical protein
VPPKDNGTTPLNMRIEALTAAGSCATRQRASWLAILVAVVLSFALRPIPWADSTGAVYGPISFLCEGNWDLDEFPFLYERTPKGEHVPWSGSAARPDPKGQSLLAFAGLGSPLTALPGAALLAAWPGVRSEIAAVLRSHQLVVVLSALAILGLTLAALRSWMGQEPPSWALPALFFGTVLWPQTRQTLWSNQSAMLGIGLVLWLAASRRDPQNPPSPVIGALLGMGMGQALLSRPSTVLITLPLVTALAWQHRSSLRLWAPALIVASMPFAALFLYDNQAHSGNPWTPPFAIIAADIAQVHGIGEGALSGKPWTGSLGLLLSPSRGLLIFSPWLIVLLPGLWHSCRSKDVFRLALLIGVFTTFLLNACYVDWWGGDSWGPRRLQELVPILLLLGLPSRFDRKDSVSLPSPRLITALLAISIAVQALGTFVYDSRWDLEHSATMSPDTAEVHTSPVEERMWTIRDGVLADSLRKAISGTFQFGWNNEITLATGWHYQPDLPPCAILRVIDRFPYEESIAKE